MKNIHNQNVAELPYCIIVFYMQGLGTCFGDAGILVQLLFVLGTLKASLLHLIRIKSNISFINKSVYQFWVI